MSLFLAKYMVNGLIIKTATPKIYHMLIYDVAVFNLRCNVDVPYSYYESSDMKRKLGPDWYKQSGCQHQRSDLLKSKAISSNEGLNPKFLSLALSHCI